jgi:hypothetical protein
MQPTTSSKITLHCSTSKGSYSFKACSVQLHCSKIGQKKFTQSTSYLSIEFLLTFEQIGQMEILPLHSMGFLPGECSRKTLWLSAGFSEFDLTKLIWGINGQIHAQRVPGICITGSQISLRIDISVHLVSNSGVQPGFVLDGIDTITGMNAEFRGPFKGRVTGRLPRGSESSLLPKQAYALM